MLLQINYLSSGCAIAMKDGFQKIINIKNTKEEFRRLTGLLLPIEKYPLLYAIGSMEEPFNFEELNHRLFQQRKALIGNGKIDIKLEPNPVYSVPIDDGGLLYLFEDLKNKGYLRTNGSPAKYSPTEPFKKLNAEIKKTLEGYHSKEEVNSFVETITTALKVPK